MNEFRPEDNPSVLFEILDSGTIKISERLKQLLVPTTNIILLNDANKSELLANTFEVWDIPDIESLTIKSKKHVDAEKYTYSIVFNYFDTEQKVKWLFQYLKKCTPELQNKWAVKIANVIDGARIDNQAYTRFWKIFLFDISSDPSDVRNRPILGGFGPNSDNSFTPATNLIINSAWKFYDGNAVRLAVLYVIKKYDWRVSDDNPYLFKINFIQMIKDIEKLKKVKS